jgi:ribonuclease P protein component
MTHNSRPVTLPEAVAKTKTENNSFGRQFRLRGRSAFLGVMLAQDSQRRKGRWCELITNVPKSVGKQAEPVTKTAGKPGTKFGISVTRKAGGAVRRNRLKRIVREYLRTHKSFWPENLLVVIRINRPVTDETDLLIEIEDMLKSAR